MKYNGILIGAAILIAGACASNTSSTAPARPATPTPAQPARTLPPADQPYGSPSAYIGDPVLYTILAHHPLDGAAVLAIYNYEFAVGGIFTDRLGEIAEDSSASVAARANALEIIAERKALRQFAPVRTALHARDPRVRAIALNTANAFRMTAASKDAMNLLKEALDDEAPEIQAKALQFIGDEDIGLLRDIAKSKNRAPSVMTVVTGIIQAAEERGAPLVAIDSAGTLQRTSATGYTVKFVPRNAWNVWDAAVGRVTLRSPQGREIVIPGDIEVVGKVVPVFFSSDGRHIVYEIDRTIRVRELATGAERIVGPGIAPRIRPVTDQFLFMREDLAGRVDMRDRVKVRYDVLSAPFVAATPVAQPVSLGAAGGFLAQAVHGNYSPARWMRLEERDGGFFLVGDALEMFPLPSPFTPGSGS